MVGLLTEHELKDKRKDKLPLYLTLRQNVSYFLCAFDALCILERIRTRPVIVGK